MVPVAEKGGSSRASSLGSYPILTWDLQHYRRADDGERQLLIRLLGDALAQVGFFSLSSTGLTAQLLREAYEMSRAFFALPTHIKQRYFYPEVRGQVGYVGWGKERAQGAQSYDLKEFWHVSRQAMEVAHYPECWRVPLVEGHYGELWPRELPRWATVLSEIYQILEACGEVLLEVCALYLGLEKNRFSRLVSGSSPSLLRVLHYPPLPDADGYPAGALRAAPHRDINLITLLCASTAEGLEILDGAGQWRGVEVPEESEVIVGSGDMLQNITHGLFPSTTHRVVNPVDLDLSRYSMPFFIHPRPDSDLTPLPSCTPKEGAHYPSITAGEYLQQRLQEIGLSDD